MLFHNLQELPGAACVSFDTERNTCSRCSRLFQSHNEEDLSEGESDSPRDHEDVDSCDEIRRHSGLLADHNDVLAKLKMQVRDIKVGGVSSVVCTFECRD